jgi:hypothetical protein
MERRGSGERDHPDPSTGRGPEFSTISMPAESIRVTMGPSRPSGLQDEVANKRIVIMRVIGTDNDWGKRYVWLVFFMVLFRSGRSEASRDPTGITTLINQIKDLKTHAASVV